MRRKLYERESGSRLNWLEAAKESLALRQQLNDLKNRERELAHELNAVAADRDAFIDEWNRKTAEELVETTRERTNAAEQLAKAERHNQLVTLTAPMDAVVLEVAKRSIGSVVKEAEPLVTLVPADVPIELETEIAARDIGLVRTGDPVRIKMEAFPFQLHGTLDGEVRTISADAFERETREGIGAFFRARIRLVNTKLRDV